MSMFSMFVNTPPAGVPVQTVYQEKRAFGPFGRAAGEQSGETGFSDALWLQIAQGAADTFKQLRVICDGTLRVLGPQSGFPAGDPASPLSVELVPAPRESGELVFLGNKQHFEAPRRFIYHGVDLASLTDALTGYFTRMTALKVLDRSTGKIPASPDFEQLISDFLLGGTTIPIVEAGLGPGQPLGTVSPRNLADGFYSVGLEIQTAPPIAPGTLTNHLDPVTLFSTLAGSKLSTGADAIDPAQTTNSWLGNVTRTRVLITFRDEWNTPLVSGDGAAIVGPATGQAAFVLMDATQTGTAVLPTGWNSYTCSIATPHRRKLTPFPSDSDAADSPAIAATAPAHRVIGTVRPEDWFQPPDPPYADPSFNLPLYTPGNIVTPMIDGIPAYEKLVADLRELDDPDLPHGRFPDNFVLLAGWWMDLDFPLIPGDPTSTMLQLLQRGAKSPHGLKARCLVWWIHDDGSVQEIDRLDPAPHYSEAAEVEFFLNELISFHWKTQVVRNRKGTFAYLGGIDLNPNRLDDPDHRLGPTGYHDVHCRIQGPAVADVVESFQERWVIHALGSDVTDSITATVDTPPGTPATQMVQIARTFRSGTGAGFQSWSPDGERTIWASLRQAITQARKYIYIEEQYLVSPTLRDLLLDRLDKVPDLRILALIPDEAEADAPVIATHEAYNRARFLFLRNPDFADPNPHDLYTNPRFHVVSIKDHYVHTKATIVDDVFATIGSANLNNRGLTHDAELNAFILDGRIEEGARKSIRDLRTRLWAEHLGMPLTPGSFTRLNDIDTALDLMTRHRPKTARFDTYLLRDAGDDYTALWTTAVDPIGF